MIDDKAHLTAVLRHIKMVEQNCNILSIRLMDKEPELALKLVQLGRLHDASKLEGIEWKYLRDGADDYWFKEALSVHRRYNKHHPEYWHGGIHSMPEEYVAEMVCDCLARSQEFGTDVRDWFFGLSKNSAPEKYGYNGLDAVSEKIEKYLDLLLTPKFKKIGNEAGDSHEG